MTYRSPLQLIALIGSAAAIVLAGCSSQPTTEDKQIGRAHV